MIFLVPFHNPHDLFPSHYYETIRQRFHDRGQLWGPEEFRARGLLTARRYYSDWAEAILLKYTSTLARIGLYDAIEVTSKHFYRETTVLKGFVEYWSPTTNSFHLPYGEMSVTLWDLHRIAGLPIIGTEFWREPYYPSRFARQFGYDQTVPKDCGLVTRRMRCYGTGPLNWAMIWKQLLNGRRSSFIIPGYDRIVHTSYGWMRWWDHQSYLVMKCFPVDSSLFLHPPRLKGRQLESGVGYIPEKSHASHHGEISHKISLEDPIHEIKPINTLDGWFAYGILREFEQSRPDFADQVLSHKKLRKKK